MLAFFRLTNARQGSSRLFSMKNIPGRVAQRHRSRLGGFDV